ncbi:MAG: lipoprotein-releasing ABC transporter permease subunit [Nitrospinae bacterium]|nr:lipoprotein-releasing ABC transporter permease subunit [Nitrospinota bacterium]
MKLELFMSLRYLKAKRRQTFISLISWISVGGVALGVMALIIVISVMTGMQNDLRDKILGTYSHVVVLNSFESSFGEMDGIIGKISATPGVVSASPYIYGEVMVSSPKKSAGAVMRGVDPKTEANVTSVNQYLKGGTSLDALSKNYADGEFIHPGVILGESLAESLGVKPGDSVNLISPKGRSGPMGMVPKIEKYHVAGLFKSGMYQYDSGMIIVSIPSAQEFYGMDGRISGIEVKVDDIYKADKIARGIEKNVGFPFYARDWMDLNQNLFYALKLEKIAIFIILILIVFVAAFNIVSTMIMVVMEKTRDIAILKSMGATSSMVMRIFFLEGAIIGVTGTVLGNVFGYIFCAALKKYQFIKIPSDVYNVKTLAVTMDPTDFIIISSCALFITIVSAAYPAWNASRLDPAEALRYE